ncbi:general stress protein [Pantoea endophytica]|uniref:general stress protein n=1 Tax=Pantoea endophytica TaxID=92488 RepID=UPI0024139355|nr:general stress protein [Pantoea endophytica]
MEEAKLRGGVGNFANDPIRAREAGKRGGRVSGGNFRNNPERAIEAGRKGGRISRRPSNPPT